MKIEWFITDVTVIWSDVFWPSYAAAVARGQLCDPETIS